MEEAQMMTHLNTRYDGIEAHLRVARWAGGRVKRAFLQRYFQHPPSEDRQKKQKHSLRLLLLLFRPRTRRDARLGTRALGTKSHTERRGGPLLLVGCQRDGLGRKQHRDACNAGILRSPKRRLAGNNGCHTQRRSRELEPPQYDVQTADTEHD